MRNIPLRQGSPLNGMREDDAAWPVAGRAASSSQCFEVAIENNRDDSVLFLDNHRF